MSVFTNLFLLVFCLSILVDGAVNKKLENSRLLSKMRQRAMLPYPTQNTPSPCLNASGSSRALPSSGLAPGSGSFLKSSGGARTGSSFGGNRVVPYPTEGAPYRNFTSTYTEQGNGEGENGQTGSGDQCPSQQTVTLPPQTITLPAQTVTITPTPETITITPQAQTETFTVTVTPQVQTTTMTVWMTVTVNQAPTCSSPGNNANPQVGPAPAQNAQPSNTPNAPIINNASTPPIVPPIVSPPNLVVPLSTIDMVPIANATLPVIPNLGPTTTTEQTNSTVNIQTSPVTSPVAQQASSFPILPIITSTPIKAPYPYPNTTNQTLPCGSGSSRGFRPTGSGFAKPTNKPFPMPGNLSTSLTPPWRANGTVFQPTTGPTVPPSPTREYFPVEGSTLTPPAQANATISPTMEYFPDNGSSLLVPPGQANATSGLGGFKAPLITSAVGGSSQSMYAVAGSVTPLPPPPITLNTSTPIPPVSTSIPPPSPSTIISSPPQPLTSSTPPVCTNGTTTTNMTTNFSELSPIPSTPLILQGLNYTTFAPTTLAVPNTTSPFPPTTHLLAPAASEPKQLALAPGSLSFSLTSLTLSCGDDDDAAPASSAPTTGNNCTVQMFGLGAPTVGGSSAVAGSERSVAVGPGMQTVEMDTDHLWQGLSTVSFSATVGGEPTGLMLGQVVYELVSGC